ncbi:TetR/AcrR family transcriptional regulator [Pseudomonas sp. TCU-HL1]|uniref:TetR/AcrR family transcriptional regulator n=1 Tax=Pseudomonas sp. TCU-HL1 TaxID=1856685 RepID=UPI00083D0174|nr:TetR/AcrR family transcriptional regulator [Pseudomonas sp. TCU-HL1]AOE86098.1 transcriptional regulator [Pseudomonas sp. TCU-HL1]
MSADTEHVIRQAAIELIACQGYEAMTLRGLAAHAGVNASTLYLYFKGKQELLASLVLDYYEDLLDAWLETKPTAVPARNAWSAFVGFHVGRHLSNRQLGLLGNLEIRCLDGAGLQNVKRARRRYLEEIQTLIRQGVAEGVFECPEPKLSANILFNLLTHACAWYRDEGRLSREEISVHYQALTSRMLAPAAIEPGTSSNGCS